MKILVICQYYYPEPFRITDICEELAKRGHEVMVVTGEPNYPEGEIYKGYEKHNKSDEVINGVKVHRCPIVPRKTGAIYRMLNYFSFPLAAKKFVKSSRCVSTDGNPFDVVFVNQLSPVMMAEPAILYKNKHNVPVLLYCLDLWPESLIAGGVKRDSLVFKIFSIISKNIYTSVDRVVNSSKLFSNYLQNRFSVKCENIGYLPQYAESIFENQENDSKSDGVTNLLFAGNIGEVQSIETIIGAANKLKDRKLKIHIVGGGSDLERLKDLVANLGLNNVVFYGRRSLEEMPKFYCMADAMLVTLKADDILSMTLPGKVQSYMAAGKPIIGAINGEAAEIIKLADCGYCGKAEDVLELTKNISRFIDSDRKRIMGQNARAFYDLHFSKVIFMDTLEIELVKLI